MIHSRVLLTLALCAFAVPAAAQSYPVWPAPPWMFAGPPARGWSGTINGSTFTYDGAIYQIVNGRVDFPDCTTFIVGPNGTLNGGALRPGCTAGGSAGLLIPTITWADPEPVFQGSRLGSRQLNASGPSGVGGEFFYTPGIGTVMDTVGPHILLVRFQPWDGRFVSEATATVTLNVIARGASTNPTNGGGWWGSITGSNLYYNNAYYPIVNGRVNLPDCTTWIVGPNGSLNGGATTPNCAPSTPPSGGGSGSGFVGPRNGGGWSGTISGSDLIYNSATYPIINGRVSFPDCTMFIVGPNGSLNGGAVIPNCTPQDR